MSEEKKPTEEIKENVAAPAAEPKPEEPKPEEAKPVEPAAEPKPEEPKAEEPKPAEEPRIEGAVNKGDFILMEMTGRAETGEVFDTTSEDLAKERGTHQEDRVYGPRLVVVGDGWVLKGLDDRLRGVKPGEPASIEISAAEAFGDRDPASMQLVPFRLLRSKGINPVPGAELEIDGRQAVIRSVAAGRVQVDYNHPLAGRKVTYEVTVKEIIADDDAKIKALVGRRFVGIDAGKFKVEKVEKRLTVAIPDEIFFGENIQIAKRGLAMDLLKYFPTVDEVEFSEVVKR